MNICIVGHTGGLGGAELAILETAEGLIKDGHQLSFICPNDGPFVKRALQATPNVQILPFDHWTAMGTWPVITKLKMARGYWIAARKIADWMRNNKPDLVITNTSTFPSAAIAAKKLSIPHLWYLHEFVAEDHGLTWQFGEEKSYRLIERLSGAVVINSKAVGQKVSRFIAPDKLHLVYCATITKIQDRERPFPDGTFRLLMAGAISEGKNQMLALEAINLVKNKDILVHLTIIGNSDKEYRGKLEDFIKEAQLSEHVTIKEFSDSLQDEFDKAHCYLMTSRNEAFGRVLVEAGRAGLPCLAPDSGGAPEIIKDHENGLLFESGSAESLAHSIQIVCTNPVLYGRLSANARPAANARFNLAMHMEQFRKAMKACLSLVSAL